MDFGNLVKLKRSNKNMTLAELEQVAGVSASFINRIENNTQKSPSVNNVYKLAKALDISSLELEQCFDVELKANIEENEVKLLKQMDYVLLKQAEDILTNVANNVGEYSDNIKKLLDITEKLKKDKIQIVFPIEEKDYIVKIKLNNGYLIELIKEALKDSLCGKVRIIKGEFITDDNNHIFDIIEFIEYLEENDKIYAFQAEGIKKYLKSINYI